MRAHEIMTRKVDTVSTTTTTAAALAQMKTKRYHHLVVLQNGKVAGLVSSRDLSGTKTERGARPLIVGDVMTQDVVSVTSDTPVRKIANVLRGRAIGCVPVMDDGKLLGIVTVTDLLDMIGHGLERGNADGERVTLANRGPRKGTNGHNTARMRGV